MRADARTRRKDLSHPSLSVSASPILIAHADEIDKICHCRSFRIRFLIHLDDRIRKLHRVDYRIP